MKRLLIIFAALTLTYACGDSGKETENFTPVCSITAPADGAVVEYGESLRISGTGSLEDGTITEVRLMIGNEIIEKVTTVPFNRTIPYEDLPVGQSKVTLYVKGSNNLTAQNEITITVRGKQISEKLKTVPADIDFGYYTEEKDVQVLAEGDWRFEIPGGNWFEFWDATANKWTKEGISGSGDTKIKMRSPANGVFTDNVLNISLTDGEELTVVTVKQEASPDFLEFLVDENFRAAASLSFVLYDIDTGDGQGGDPDFKISAAEIEVDPYDSKGRPKPYGIDAGGYVPKTVKGIEYFKYLKHLDVNRSPDLRELDLSGNPNLMSIHIHECPGIESVDLSPLNNLMEIGCDYKIYVQLDRTQMSKLNTLAVFNRQDEHPEKMDLSGFSQLARLYLYDNDLKEIDLTGCGELYLINLDGNDMEEVDLTEIHRGDPQYDDYPYNLFTAVNCPNLKRVKVWPGYREAFYIFSVPQGVEIIEVP